jgi:hypothetical protein
MTTDIPARISPTNGFPGFASNIVWTTSQKNRLVQNCQMRAALQADSVSSHVVHLKAYFCARRSLRAQSVMGLAIPQWL